MGTFSQDVKYIAPCTFCDIFDVKCPLSDAKRVFSFFPEQMNVWYVSRDVGFVRFTAVLT